MNNQRRKSIQAAIDALQDLVLQIEGLRDEEQEYYDYMPESIQSGEKGDNAQTAIDSLDSAATYLSDALDSLQEASQ